MRSKSPELMSEIKKYIEDYYLIRKIFQVGFSQKKRGVAIC